MLVNLCYKRHRQINKANAVAGLKTSSISFMKSFHNPIFTSYLEAKFGQNIVSILKLSYVGSLVTRGLAVLQQNLVSWITWNTYYVNTSFLKQILRSRVGWSVKIKKKKTWITQDESLEILYKYSNDTFLVRCWRMYQ